MRPTLLARTALPLFAGIALAACQGDAPATDEALTGDEIAGMTDTGTMLQPGEYSATQDLIEIDAPGATEEQVAAMRTEFAAGAAEPQLYCVTEGMTREEWLSALAQASCTLSSLTAEGGSIEGAMSCNADQGLNGRVDFAGTVEDTSAALRMTYPVPLETGDITVRFGVQSQRTGDSCG
ncbi:DUF3617 family protein [Erythrobacter arachoides]|uniref:DUF3617 family protein n=1 Tax=Aurantiacibacter arachoides TaxID=1850444 RepID=A0A845A277_9SPHN|nr:DUF3617 family protein [Aurantiacibacter arachoides]MXO93794.1 DUF3617 family protein [Aurantiacibacter arachoides]GGD46608.1 hypothetical protein GCM10011411_02880 [Aurantiacibacter arachoides]